MDTELTEEEIIRIMEDGSIKTVDYGMWTYKGLQILNKYVEIDISGAVREVIWVDIEAQDLIDNGITKEDIILLKSYNWMYKGEYPGFSSFV